MRTQLLSVFTTLALVLVTNVNSIALPDSGLVDYRHLKARQAAAPASNSRASTASSAVASPTAKSATTSSTTTVIAGGGFSP